MNALGFPTTILNPPPLPLLPGGGEFWLPSSIPCLRTKIFKNLTKEEKNAGKCIIFCTFAG
jgi:hypothetical protein